MNQPADITVVMDRLKIELQGWRVTRWPKAVTFTPPSILTDIVYAGCPIRRLMLPRAPKSIEALAEAFDAMISGEPITSLSQTEIDFVQGNPARLLVWASARKGADLEMSVKDNLLMVIAEETFGFADGRAYGRYGDVPYSIQLEGMFAPKPYTTRDSGFLSLRRRAKKLKRPDAIAVLDAIRVTRTSPWRAIAPWVWGDQEASPELTDAGEIIHVSPDPIGDLYSFIVPMRMSKQKFEDRICPLKGRPIDLSPADRAKLWRKIVKVFI